MPHADGTAGNLGLPGRGPISWEEMGERTPEGRGSSLWTPFSGGVVWGEVVVLAGYLASGPHMKGAETARPRAGRAGDGAALALHYIRLSQAQRERQERQKSYGGM